MIMFSYPKVSLRFFFSQTNEHATLKLNSAARTVVAFRNCGCAISTMIAVMILMNQLTCAVKEIVQQDGGDAQDNRTTAAFPNGSSVMEKTIVVIIAMNCQKIAPCVNPKLNSNVRTIDAFPSNGLVTLLTTAVMVRMNLKLSARGNTENVLNLSSVVRMANAFQADGDVVSCNFKLSFECF